MSIQYLYHGPRDSDLDAILEEGIDGPSYWGTYEKALEYAKDDGRVFRVAMSEFDMSDLSYNTLLAEAMIESGNEDVAADGTWEESIAVLDSVRYDGRIYVTEANLITGPEDGFNAPSL